MQIRVRITNRSIVKERILVGVGVKQWLISNLKQKDNRGIIDTIDRICQKD